MSNYRFRAILFDLDGVMIDSNPAIIEFWSSWANKTGFQLTQPMILEWVYGRKVTATIEGLFSHCDQKIKKEIEADGYRFDSNMAPSGIKGIQEFVKQLNQISFPRGVATSSHYERMLKMLRNIEVADQFEHFVTAHDVSKGKPDPEPYLKMAEKMNIDPIDCLVFEDAISGVQSAITAGMQVIGIGNHITKDALISNGALEVVEDFLNLCIKQDQLITLNGNNYQLIIE